MKMISKTTSSSDTNDEALTEILPKASKGLDRSMSDMKSESQQKNHSNSPSRCLPSAVAESRRMSKATVGVSSVQSFYFTLNPFDRFKVDDLTNYAMNDQRWTLQRKKIGLQRKTSAAKQRKNRNEKAKELTLNFLRSTFCRKECLRYSLDAKRSEMIGYDICRCGLIRKEHYSYQQEAKLSSVKKLDNVFYDASPNHHQNGKAAKNYTVSPRRKLEDMESGELYPRRYRPSVVNDEEKMKESFDEFDFRMKEIKMLPDDTQNMIVNGINQNARNIRKNKISPKSEITDRFKNLSGVEPAFGTIPEGVAEEKKIRWNPQTCLAEFPTNAYGTIEFLNESSGSNKPAKYVRLSDTTEMKHVVSLLTDYWRLMEPSRPHLIMSVVGGAKNFRLDGKRKEDFISGLLKVVKSTQAWIVTGGMQTGITKGVGDAIKEGQFIVKVKRKFLFSEEYEHLVQGIKCIGVSPWGYVKNNHLLINQDLNDFSQVKYKMEESGDGYENICLNGNHTHFLLVDNGIRNRYSGAHLFRTKLLQAIQESGPVGLGIPVVLLLLEGGICTLIECCMALKSNIPVVIVTSTGRAADLIAYGLSMTIQTSTGKFMLRKGHKKHLLARVESAMFELDERQHKKCVDLITECCSFAHLLTIYDINSGEGMDKFILCALLKGGTDMSTKIDQLNLALLWNRPDIAENQIFPSYSVWPTEALVNLMTTALIEDKVEFVQLLSVNGLIMREYLTVQRLRTLYDESYSLDTHFGKMLERCCSSSTVSLADIHTLLEALVEQHVDPVYIRDTFDSFHDDPSVNCLTFEDPYHELLLWAILSNRGKLAIYLWERCNSPLVAAIIATCIYRSLWRSLGAKNTIIRAEYAAKKDHFEKLAVNYLEECYEIDPNNAMGMIERRHKKWGDLDCLELAQYANDLVFISSPCCQASVDICWRRGMIKAPSFGVLIAIFFPFLLWTPVFKFQKLGDNEGNLTLLQKLLVFYKSPICKFCCHSTVFVFVLLLYTYVILFDFRPEMSYAEKFLLLFIFCFFLEELNEIVCGDASSLRGKLIDYFDSVWNRFDAVALALAIIAFILRLNPITFKWGRVTYALNANIFYIRLFRIYHVNYRLGPKLVIFYRMITEVLLFMAFLIIFILGYGIASQALLHPGRTFSTTNITSVLKDILLIPYWQMYGELFLERLEGVDEEKCALSTTWEENICENPKEYAWIAKMMLAIYLIIGNIMLLNLLIAIFTYVFDEVQENSMEIWKFEMFRLIREYDKKPGLIAPLVILEYIYRLSKFIWKKCCKQNEENLDDYMRETLNSLAIFERESMTAYLSKLKDSEAASLNSVVAKMAERIEKISKYIDEEEELKEIEEDIEWAVLTELEEKNNLIPSNNELGDLRVSPNPKIISIKEFEQLDDDFDVKNEDEVKIMKLDGENENEDCTEGEDGSDEEGEIENYKDGFTNLPFPNLSRPASERQGSSRSIMPRPTTAKSTHVLKNTQFALRNHQDHLNSISRRVDTLQETVDDLGVELRQMIRELIFRFEDTKLEREKK